MGQPSGFHQSLEYFPVDAGMGSKWQVKVEVLGLPLERLVLEMNVENLLQDIYRKAISLFRQQTTVIEMKDPRLKTSIPMKNKVDSLK